MGNAHGGPDPDAGMVKIPAGWFIMGSDEGPDDTHPKRRVYLNAYFIDKFEITNAQYKEFLVKRAKRKSEGERVRVPAPFCRSKDMPTNVTGQVWDKKTRTYPEKYANHPVTCVSWYAANMYCEDQGKKLPTEAQWEKAARGSKGNLYPWGNEWEDSNSSHGLGKEPWEDDSDGYGRTAPVGSFPKDKSPYGVYDMAGNVWEWTADIYSNSYYTWGPKKNPPGPKEEEVPTREMTYVAGVYLYVMRGGSWALTEERQATYTRVARPQIHRDIAGGFRCAKGY